MKENRLLTILLSLAFALVLCFGMTACGGSGGEQSADADQEAAEEELSEDEIEENAELEAKEEAMIEAEENAEERPIRTDTKYEDFVGSWETVTEMADDFFGGYKITFHEDMTFDAIVTGEEETGKCVFEGGVATAQNEVLNDQFWFNDDGILVVSNEGGAMAMLKKAE